MKVGTSENWKYHTFFPGMYEFLDLTVRVGSIWFVMTMLVWRGLYLKFNPSSSSTLGITGLGNNFDLWSSFNGTSLNKDIPESHAEAAVILLSFHSTRTQWINFIFFAHSLVNCHLLEVTCFGLIDYQQLYGLYFNNSRWFTVYRLKTAWNRNVTIKQCNSYHLKVAA